FYAEAVTAARPLEAAENPDAASLECVARLQRTRYLRALTANDNDAAETEMRKLVDLHRRLVRLEPNNRDREIERIDTEMLFASQLVTNRKLQEADPLVVAAAKALDRMPEQQDAKVRKSRLAVRGTLGLLRENQNCPAEAEVEYKAVLEGYR